MHFDKIIFDGFVAALEAGAPGQLLKMLIASLTKNQAMLLHLVKRLGRWQMAGKTAVMMDPALLLQQMKATEIMMALIVLLVRTLCLINVG